MKGILEKEVIVPIAEKYAVTMSEGAEYFNIGINKLRKIAAENLDYGFVIQNGNRFLIKRKKFEEYLDNINSL